MIVMGARRGGLVLRATESRITIRWRLGRECLGSSEEVRMRMGMRRGGKETASTSDPMHRQQQSTRVDLSARWRRHAGEKLQTFGSSCIEYGQVALNVLGQHSKKL